MIPAVRRLFLMMNTGIAAYFGITIGPEDTWLCEHHVVALDANAAETVGLEDLSQSLVGDRTKL